MDDEMSKWISERQYIAVSNRQTLTNIQSIMSQLMVYGLVDDEHLKDDVKAIHASLDRMVQHYRDQSLINQKAK